MELRLEHRELGFDVLPVGDRGLEGAALPSLERLRVTMNAKLSCPVLTSMPKLRVATLSVCSHLLDAAVTALCDGAPLLDGDDVVVDDYTGTLGHWDI